MRVASVNPIRTSHAGDQRRAQGDDPGGVNDEQLTSGVGAGLSGAIVVASEMVSDPRRHRLQVDP
jgi:hypothetical protein